MKAGANAGRAPLGVLPVEQAAAEKFTRPRHQCHDSIIYELHVKGFTARENSGVTKENRGKFWDWSRKSPT
jgi:glycogen operon protein